MRSRGNKLLGCGAKRRVSAFADKEPLGSLSYSLSAKADIRRFAP